MKPEDKIKLEGIGGWVILPIIGLFGSIIVLLDELIMLFGFLEGNEIFIVLDIAWILLIIYTLIAIFQKKKTAIRLAMIAFAVNGLTNLIAVFYVGDVPSFAGVIGSVVWMFYFAKSRRVENTFVN